VTIPAEIAHLDFEPGAKSEEEFTKLRECKVRLRHTQQACVNPATWEGTFRCCMKTFPCCSAHKRRGLTAHWYCLACKKTRSDEWIGWIKL